MTDSPIIDEVEETAAEAETGLLDPTAVIVAPEHDEVAQMTKKALVAWLVDSYGLTAWKLKIARREDLFPLFGMTALEAQTAVDAIASAHSAKYAASSAKDEPKPAPAAGKKKEYLLTRPN